MTVGNFIHDMSKQLADAGIQTARLDCMIMLEDILGRNRANILAHPELVIATDQLATLNKYITRRLKHEPLAYIRGKAAFYGRDFTVNEHVLVPRPETESMIEIMVGLPLPKSANIVDVGCGSGCLGITAKLELTTSNVTLYDISQEALAVASMNANNLGAEVDVAPNDLLTGTTNHYDLVLANLPYVPHDYAINQAASHEPPLALFADNDGLALYEHMFAQLAAMSTTKADYVLTEALSEQLEHIADIAKAAGYHERQRSGLVQLFSL